MIRRTVARAFGLTGDERPKMEKSSSAGAGPSRVALVNGLFTEIREAFERAVREGAPPASEGGAPPEERAAGGVAVTKARPRPEGLEFLVEGPGGSFRFLNAMDGIAWIFRGEGGGFVEERLLSIQFEGDRPRLIDKPVGVPRSPFRCTAVPDIVREYRRRAGGGPARVDTRSAPP